MARKSNLSFRLKDFSQRFSAFMRTKGLYVVLFVCLGLVGLVAAIAFSGNNPNVEPDQKEIILPTPKPTLGSAAVSQTKDESLQTEIPEPTAKPSPIPDFTKKPSVTPRPSKTKTISVTKMVAPVSGQVIWNYAMEELIYSRTLNQWMTHQGVDIAGAKGDEVYAVFAGTVEDVYEDDLMGVTVVIVSDRQMRSVYSNLKLEPPVKKGQLVNARTVIGHIGDTALAECADPSHLHFELYRDGKAVNPEDYIQFEKARIE